VEVTAADMFDFLADQRGDRTVIRLADRESGLSARTIPPVVGVGPVCVPGGAGRYSGGGQLGTARPDDPPSGRELGSAAESGRPPGNAIRDSRLTRVHASPIPARKRAHGGVQLTNVLVVATIGQPPGAVEGTAGPHGHRYPSEKRLNWALKDRTLPAKLRKARKQVCSPAIARPRCLAGRPGQAARRVNQL
jgi:hypothetical protein